jgi:hypothetical protein
MTPEEARKKLEATRASALIQAPKKSGIKQDLPPSKLKP